MARSSIIVAAIVLVLGLLSVGAGLAAELTRVKASQIRIVGNECVHPSSPTMGLAVTAAASLVLLRLIVNVATGGGFRCCRTDPNIPKLIRYCIFVAWVMSVVAVSQFIAGAKLSRRKDINVSYMGYSCYYLKPGMLSTAAIEALISLCLTLFYYLVIVSTQNIPIKQPASEVEAPPVSNDPEIPPQPAHPA